MKYIKSLSIISALLFFNCTNNNEPKHKKEEVNQTEITELHLPIDTIQAISKLDTIELQKDSLNNVINKVEKQQDSIKKNNENKKSLKVIIDGKVYYKKDINDKPVGGKYKTHFYNQEKDNYYDIVTGKYVFIYGKHGKIIK